MRAPETLALCTLLLAAPARFGTKKGSPALTSFGVRGSPSGSPGPPTPPAMPSCACGCSLPASKVCLQLTRRAWRGCLPRPISPVFVSKVIGTRDSELALWQAHTVQKKLNDLGFETEIIAVKSQGDILLDKPLYELGITGIFTKTLDIAMLNGQVNIAVHSMKDVPTALPKGIVQAAVLERANTLDILVHKGNLDFLNTAGTIATGSLRRQAQWLNKYPNHNVVDLRGNVNTRMQKLQDNDWNGAVFAAAGLERINLKPQDYINLDWMVPAPAQGAMVVVAMENDPFCREALAQLNHKETEICTHIEREFLKTLEGGCTAPIGALATFSSDKIEFEGVLFSLNGKEKQTIKKSCTFDSHKNFGEECAQEILNSGGKTLMESIRRDLKK